MAPQDAQNNFIGFVTEQGLSLPSLTATAGIEAALQFYSEVRAEGCDLDTDADMLLFQWGSDKGGSFLDITRQFILDDTTGDEGIWQLSLTFRYGLAASPPDLESGNAWCSTPAELDEFTEAIHQNLAYQALATLPPSTVFLNYDNAG